MHGWDSIPPIPLERHPAGLHPDQRPDPEGYSTIAVRLHDTMLQLFFFFRRHVFAVHDIDILGHANIQGSWRIRLRQNTVDHRS